MPSFGVSNAAADAKTGTECSKDYVEIIGGSATCGGTSLGNRYCGVFFSNNNAGMMNAVVCGTVFHNHYNT